MLQMTGRLCRPEVWNYFHTIGAFEWQWLRFPVVVVDLCLRMGNDGERIVGTDGVGSRLKTVLITEIALMAADAFNLPDGAQWQASRVA